MNNTKKQSNKQQPKNQLQKTRHAQGAKKQGRNPGGLHQDVKHDEHEYPETRLTR